MKKWILMIGPALVLGVGAYLFFSQTLAAEKYENPVFEPVLADPTIIKGDDGYYYAYGTEDAWGDDSETKLIPIIRSKNLTEWEYVGEAFEEKPSWKVTGGLWAPEITKYKDKYYLYYSFSLWGDPNPGIGVAVADTPAGPFEDKGKLFDSKGIGVANSIDPFFYVHEDKPYMVWGSFHGIYGVELTEDGLAVAGEPFQLAGTDYEAPYIIQEGDYYYFFGSRGSCCEGANSTYNVAVGRSESFFGPYVDQEGRKLIDNGGTLILEGNERFAGPGHNTMVRLEDQDWLVYHAIEKEDPLLWTGASRRPLMIDPIIWQGGWPTIEHQEPSNQGKIVH